MFLFESLVSSGFFLGAGGAAVAVGGVVLLAQKVGGADVDPQMQIGSWLVLSLLFTVMSRLRTAGRTDVASATPKVAPDAPEPEARLLQHLQHLQHLRPSLSRWQHRLQLPLLRPRRAPVLPRSSQLPRPRPSRPRQSPQRRRHLPPVLPRLSRSC